MKFNIKLCSILLMLICLGQTLAGCQNDMRDIVYESKITDVSNDSVGIGLGKVEKLWPSPDYKQLEGTSKSCEFMGKLLTGQHSISLADRYTTRTEDWYITSDGIDFCLDSKTGELTFVYFPDSDFYETEYLLDDVANPEETAVAIAEEIAKEYIELSNYERKVIYEVLKEGTEQEFGQYYVVFEKNIQGYQTKDTFEISVSSKGTLISVRMGCFGAMDDISVKIDKQKVNDSAITKVKELYAESSYTLIDIEIEDQILGETQKGEKGIISFIRLELQGRDSTTLCTGIEIFTYLHNM